MGCVRFEKKIDVDVYRNTCLWATLAACSMGWLFAPFAAVAEVGAQKQTAFRQPALAEQPDLFLWTDACNVYVLRNGRSALLIDLGDGSVLDHLGKIGVDRVEWVLFTHHHREQCQGFPRLRRLSAEKGWETKVAVPEAEQALFERPSEFRKMKVTLNDPFTVYGSSYVRPSVEPISVDRVFTKMDTFDWGKYSFWCLETRGSSPGSMSYMLRSGSSWLAFTGDLVLADARLHTWHDSEWDYGFGAGIWALGNSAGQVVGFEPAWLFPSHGEPIDNPVETLERFRQKLIAFEKLYLRGYPVHTFSNAIQDKVSRPSAVPQNRPKWRMCKMRWVGCVV